MSSIQNGIYPKRHLSETASTQNVIYPKHYLLKMSSIQNGIYPKRDLFKNVMYSKRHLLKTSFIRNGLSERHLFETGSKSRWKREGIFFNSLNTPLIRQCSSEQPGLP